MRHMHSGNLAQDLRVAKRIPGNTFESETTTESADSSVVRAPRCGRGDPVSIAGPRTYPSFFLFFWSTLA
jgi:hypothetical protein